MRASDLDRQRTIEELRRHCAAGRIDVDEYASRLERTHAAATLEELDEIRSDLPMLRIAEPAGLGSRAASTRLPALPMADLFSGRRDDGVPGDQRLRAMAVAVIAVVVVLAAVLIGLLFEWSWAVVLLIGWAAGMLQSRISRASRRTS
ncbi:MAG TPA: DUF1707 domain-containing protein [Acidimicrobiales bacterium]|jgi:hypothetical protein|nr:DUF1707 domain-containing protein [Acidimicrobiales bacterium]